MSEGSKDGENAPSTAKLVALAVLVVAFLGFAYVMLVVIGDDNDDPVDCAEFMATAPEPEAAACGP